MSTSLTISQIWVLHILFLPECIHRTILSYTYCKSHQPVNHLTLKHLCWRGENPWRTIFEKQLDLIESVSHPAKSKAFTININDTLLMTDKYLLNSFGRLKKATDIRMNKKIFDNKATYVSLKGIKKQAIIPSRWIENNIQVNKIYCTMTAESLDLNDCNCTSVHI